MNENLNLSELTAALEKAIENPKLSATKTTFISVTNILAFCKQLTSLKAIFITEPIRTSYVEDIDSLLDDFEEEFIERTLQRLESLGIKIEEKDKAGKKTIIVTRQQDDVLSEQALNQMLLSSYLKAPFAPPMNPFMQPMYSPYPAYPQPPMPAPQGYATPAAPAQAPAATTASQAPKPAAPKPVSAPKPQESSSLDEPYSSSDDSETAGSTDLSGGFNLGGGNDEPAAGRDFLLGLLSK